jgi:predicted nucleic acid-binding protein
MKYYADSSFLVSCYLLDANTARAKAWLLKTSAPLPFTDLHLLEVSNAMRLGVFRDVITKTEAKAALADIDSDLLEGRLLESAVDWASAFHAAARLSEKHSAIIGSRSLDILHIAAAKALRATELLSFDTRQRALAAAAGLQVFP